MEKKENKAITKIKKKQKKERRTTQFYYSFLTIVLFICLVQMSFSAMLNITKVIAYHKKIHTLEVKQQKAKETNELLKKDINNFKTNDAVESIARNSLMMAGPKELVVVLTKKRAPEAEKPSKHKKFIGF